MGIQDSTRCSECENDFDRFESCQNKVNTINDICQFSEQINSKVRYTKDCKLHAVSYKEDICLTCAYYFKY